MPILVECAGISLAARFVEGLQFLVKLFESEPVGGVLIIDFSSQFGAIFIR